MCFKLPKAVTKDRFTDSLRVENIVSEYMRGILRNAIRGASFSELLDAENRCP